MIESTLMGAVLLAATSGTALAATQTYTFYSTDGVAYCDGIGINASNGVALGQHIYNQSSGCQYPNADIGGVEGSLPTLGPGKWYSLAESEATGDSLPTDYTAVIYVNLRALKWRMAVESTNYNVPFQIIFSGILGKGAPLKFNGNATLLSSAKHRLSSINH